MERTAGVLKVMVVAQNGAVSSILRHLLPKSRFQTIVVEPGPAFVGAVHRTHPDIAVLEGVHERRGSASMEVAVLKDLDPEVRVIVVSGAPSPADGSVVEQGVFYYMAGAPPMEDVVRVVEAAAAAIEGRANGSGRSRHG